jgi:hypothetical protein
MRKIIAAGLIAVSFATPLNAEGRRVYVGALAGLAAGERGPIGGDALATAGGIFGLRLSRSWSVEAEIERGFRTRERTDEALWMSRVDAGATREEIERNGIYARFRRIERAGAGWTVAAVWTRRSTARVNPVLFAGIGSNRFDVRTIRTVTSFGPGVDPSPSNPDLRPADDTRTIVGGGATGGLRLDIRLTPSLTVGPEFRYTIGIITDDPYRVARISGRILWGF